MNREQWLNQLANKAVRYIGSTLELHDEEPAFKLSCGFPVKQGKRNPIVAQLVPPTNSDDFNAEIFVSPTVSEKQAVAKAILPLLVAVAIGDYKQGVESRRTINRLRLNEDTLPSWAVELLAELPAYPHAKVSVPTVKKQTTRLIKVACLNDGYIARVSRSTLENLGAPICPACNQSLTESN